MKRKKFKSQFAYKLDCVSLFKLMHFDVDYCNNSNDISRTGFTKASHIVF